MDVLERLEQEFVSLRDSGALAAAFHDWRARHGVLRRFPAIDDLIAACRDQNEGSQAAVDATLWSLCEEARSGGETAGILLVWLLLPGLLLARSRPASFGCLSREEVTSEMLTGLWEEATHLSSSSRQVAARLVNSARWRALAAAREALGWNGRAEPLPDDPAAESFTYEVMSDVEEDDLSVAVRDGVLSQADVELLLARRQVFVETCEQLGIPLRAAEMRRFRARLRLREWVSRTYRIPTPGRHGPNT